MQKPKVAKTFAMFRAMHEFILFGYFGASRLSMTIRGADSHYVQIFILHLIRRCVRLCSHFYKSTSLVLLPFLGA